jgi:16S rRNA (cytosine967-C5)-methyltransferase
MTARRAAYQVVLRVFEDDAYADRVLRTAAANLDARDRALAQRLAFGTVQRVRTLDHAIATLGKRPVRKLDPPVRAALRLGAYQLGFTEIATHAAVNETVELVREARLERAVAFTNAVMRRLSEGIHALLASLTEGAPRDAALKHSYPDWVAELWWYELGRDDALALMRAQNEPPERVVRINRRKQGHVEGRPDPDFPDALHVERIDDAALDAGLIWPQSRGSQLAGLVVGAREGERTLDLCAAPGGKATQLPPGLTGFDRVLVDAPCSGLGVLAGRPDLRWHARPLPELQRDLLRVAAERVKPGGTIVYSVCTINTEENEAIVDASGLEVEPLGDEWPQFRHPSRPDFLLTLPHVHHTSGFFIARLRT